MPPKVPKVFQLLIRTHNLTIYHTMLPTTSVVTVKEETLSALTSNVNQAEDVPRISSLEEFDLCRASKGKPVKYEALDETKELKDIIGLGTWEVLYVRFKDPETGKSSKITFTAPSMDDDEILSAAPEPEPVSSKSQGKRKARDDDDEDD
ncbi:hypothetical protein BDN72DRAFT_376664 [Pluteus cervinus]|uniref:Uncharacterized protein n=1 Tax=Pluteus cervinus TaxID=181527 RepID=A0ACD3ABC1_9AGAR|nr:hypothetical protein BDN72DRAFT_376664 [Pluteus cervinus]